MSDGILQEIPTPYVKPALLRYERMGAEERMILSAYCERTVGVLKNVVPEDEITGITTEALFRNDPVYAVIFVFRNAEAITDIFNAIKKRDGLDGLIQVAEELEDMLKQLLEVLEQNPNTTLYPNLITSALGYISNYPIQTLEGLRESRMPGERASIDWDQES